MNATAPASSNGINSALLSSRPALEGLPAIDGRLPMTTGYSPVTYATEMLGATYEAIYISNVWGQWISRTFERPTSAFLLFQVQMQIRSSPSWRRERMVGAPIDDTFGPYFGFFRHIESGVRVLLSGGQLFFANEQDVPRVYELCKEFNTTKGFDVAELDHVFWTSSTSPLREDITAFLHPDGRSFFRERGFGYKRAYLLYGPPGNGKSSLIKAVAKGLKAKVETFDFSAGRQSPDAEFVAFLTGKGAKEERGYSSSSDDDDEDQPKGRIRVVALEDLDRFFEKGTKETPVSLSAILNGLDGAVELDNVIVFASANNEKYLDQHALTRPGRFDMQVHFNPPSVDQAGEYMRRFLRPGDCVSDATLRQVANDCAGHSFAFIRGVMLLAGSKAFNASSSSVTDANLTDAAAVWLNRSEKLKSDRKGVGF